jgi:hypothetical protein
MKTDKQAKKAKKTKGKGSAKSAVEGGVQPKYPRHSIEKALRIPRAILEQGAGKDCSLKDAAGYLGLTFVGGPFNVEISSGKKYGFLEGSSKQLKVTDRARKVLRPQSPDEELEAVRAAVFKAPTISEVYNHYRGENLPQEEQFFDNTLINKFKIPVAKLGEFKIIFKENLQKAHLLDEHEGGIRVIDFSKSGGSGEDESEHLKKLSKSVKISDTDTCFVMMPFSPPHGNYYSLIFEPAIRKAGLKPVRADNEIFGTGKIMEQIWTGINSAIVLAAELTTKNPNVFYELGLAHALKKPVVLVSSNENDVPFDLKHIRVIYYDLSDPFWGSKLIDKIAENILSAIKNPEEAIFKN